MKWRSVIHILGLLLMMFSSILLVPLAYSLLNADGNHRSFFSSFAVTFATGLVFWLLSGRKPIALDIRGGFLITAMFWIALSLFSVLPFLLSAATNMSFEDALFESISGLTTTGATVIIDISALPDSLLLYRQILQWLGGIGIIVIAVSILPILGIGGMQLYRSEIPGPMKDSKLAPRIAQSAKIMFAIYCVLTATCALSYWGAGMSLFDAICHSFSTVSIGGFSTHNNNMEHFADNTLLLLVSIVFMALSAINFTLHFATWSGRSLKHYLRDPECRFFLGVLATLAIVTWLLLKAHGEKETTLIQSIFQTVSLVTTTGYTVSDFYLWPTVLPFMLMAAAFIGGCAGSTAGGIKMLRAMLVGKQGLCAIRQLVHPQGVFLLKLGNSVLDDEVITAVWNFVAIYTITFLTLLMGVLATGIDFNTAFHAVGATLNNIGPGLGSVAEHYADINSPAKWILCAAMLLGRLEVFTLLVLLTPTFWRN